MKHGFTIIELMIALLISSLVGMSLYKMFFQTSRAVKEMVQIIHADEPIYPIYSQLQNDITGMFAPRATVNFYLKSLPDPDTKKNNSEEKKEPPKPAEKSDQEKKKEENIIKNIFFIETKETGYLFLSFITTGGISQLESNGSLSPSAFVRRVAYVIQADPARAGTMKLLYKYSNNDLAIDAIKKPGYYPSYTILDGIKDFAIEFTIFEPQSSENKDQAKGSAKVVLKEWKEDEIFKKYKALIPAYITIKGNYVDDAGKVLHPFEFDFRVYSYSNYELPPKPKGKAPAPVSPPKAPANSENAMDKISKFFEGTFANKNNPPPK